MASYADHQRSRLAPILRLPLELRQYIYALLIPCENVSHPLPSVGITSVSHRPPSSALLNVHPTITDEILDYFYTISTWKLVFSHAFNFFRIDPELRRLEQSPSLACFRRVEVVFFCDILLLREYPSFGVEKFCAEIERRAWRACEVLATAPKLKQVTVSWIDTTHTKLWSEKARVLRPLRKLAERPVSSDGRTGPITFRVGKVSGPDDVDRDSFVKAMQGVLGVDQVLETGADGALDDQPSSLRLLAFDVRQERHKIYGQPGSLPVLGRGRSGWRGAPPVLASPAEED